MFPPSMLAQLFVKGSLKNTPTGFEFKLKNIIDSGTIIGMAPLGVDEASLAPEVLTVKIGEKVLQGSAISHSSPMSVRSYAEILISATGEPLSAGSHKLTIAVVTREAGRLQFSVNENVA